MTDWRRVFFAFLRKSQKPHVQSVFCLPPIRLIFADGRARIGTRVKMFIKCRAKKKNSLLHRSADKLYLNTYRRNAPINAEINTRNRYTRRICTLLWNVFVILTIGETIGDANEVQVIQNILMLCKNCQRLMFEYSEVLISSLGMLRTPSARLG